MRRRATALFLPLALGCGAGAAPTPSVGVVAIATATASSAAPIASTAPTVAGSSSRENRLIARMLKRVSRARGLAPTRPVPGMVLARPDLIAKVKEHVVRELPADAIRNEGIGLKLLGFIPAALDYEGAEFELLEEQLAGYYEPSDATMYLAADLDDTDAEATLAHELVHALQDQHWNLAESSKYRPGDGDRSETMSALAEGDATSAMFDVMLAKMDKLAPDLPDDLFSQQLRAGMNTGKVASSPQYMRASLVAPYQYGTLFVHALRRRGGWALVNRAWEAAPTTTEQILHVAKYDAHETAIALGALPLPSPEWKVDDDDSEGELGVRIAFEEWMNEDAAAAFATGWGGDKSVLVSNGADHAVAWRIRYDPSTTEAFVARAFGAVATGLETKLGAPKTKTSAAVCFERSDLGPFAVMHVARDLVFVLGSASGKDAQWASSSTCARAGAWAAQIAKAP
jgi:hypothetical protein